MTPIAPLITTFLREHMPIEEGMQSTYVPSFAHTPCRLLFIFAGKRLESKALTQDLLEANSTPR